MIRLLKQFLSSEKGQALPIVLGLLAIGGLTIAVSLNYTTTSLKGNQILEEDVRGIYAASAGVEHALWSLINDVTPLTQLSEDINQMAANIQVEDNGTRTIYLGELIEPGVHTDYLTVDVNIVEEGEVYKFIITITSQQAEIIHLEQVGARIPVNYIYEPGSAAGFAENLSTDEPEETLDSNGAYLLNWELSPPYPSISQEDPEVTQTFYITGEGIQEDHYAWVVASRSDVGVVGEITGTSYKITATALRPGDSRATAKIVADIIVEDETTIHIMSWQISN